VQYNLPELINQRNKGVILNIIAQQYNVSRQALSKALKKHLAKSINSSTDYIKSTNTNIKGNISTRPPGSRTRLPAYGKVEPTKFHSSLTPSRWIRNYCGKGFEWELNYLSELSLLMNTQKRYFAFLPRSYGKTTEVIGDCAYWLLEKRLPYLMFTAGPTGKNRIFRKIKSILKSPKVRRDYGDVADSFNALTGEIWFKEEIYEHTDPTLKVSGRMSDVIGLHPKRIHFEDIIQEEFKGPESNEALYEWYNEVVEYLATEDTIMGGTGTRKGISDWYSKIMRQNYYVLHKKAINIIGGDWPTIQDCKVEQIAGENGFFTEIIHDVDLSAGEFEWLYCPNWSLKALMIRRIMNLSSFESQMQNNPLPESGLYFSKDDWIEVPPFDLSHIDDYFISCDAGYGQSKSADNTAIIVGGIYAGKLYIVDGMIKRLKFDEILDQINTYRFVYKPHQIFVETDFAQVWLKQEGQKKGLSIVGVKQKTNKIMRIDALKPFYNSGMIVIYSNCPAKHTLYKEYLQYDRRDSKGDKHDDGLDALATLLNKTSHYLVRTTSMKAYSGVGGGRNRFRDAY
jgi:predicted phage terminase large subunit-like protein